MLSFEQLNKSWKRCLLVHAETPLTGADGKPYRAIGDKSLRFLEEVWKFRRAPLPDLGTMIEAGKSVKFWADPHFGHANFIKMAARTRFSDVDSMDAVIWDEVERAGESCDMLVCLGDLAMKNPVSWQRKLKTAFGDRQIGLVGNHDAKGADPSLWASMGAVSSLAFSLPLSLVRPWIETADPDMASLVDWKSVPGRIHFGCSHWPVPHDRLPGPAWVNLHGHIHNRESGPLGVNLSVEAIGYTPKTLAETLTPALMDDLARRARGALPEARHAKVPGDSESV